MRKIFCDKCGKEIKNLRYRVLINDNTQQYGEEYESFEVCTKCKNQIKKEFEND